MPELSRKSADVLVRILEAATNGNWPNTRDQLVEQGFETHEVIEAWKDLERIAGVSEQVLMKGIFETV